MAGKRGLAEQVRVGLGEGQRAVQLRLVEKNVSELDRIWFNKPIRKHVREFGALFGAICLGLAAFGIYREGSPARIGFFLGLGAVFVALGYLAPKALHPIWKGWMYLAEKLSIVMTFLILFISWSGMMMPVGLLLKLFRVKTVDLSYRAPVTTYWEDRAEKYHDFQLLERQF